MAKLKREVVGSFLKAKEEGKAPYIKIKNAVAFKEGDIIRVENKKFQMASLESAIQAGKLSGDNAEKARERINNIPEFVLGELIVLRDA